MRTYIWTFIVEEFRFQDVSISTTALNIEEARSILVAKFAELVKNKKKMVGEGKEDNWNNYSSQSVTDGVSDVIDMTGPYATSVETILKEESWVLQVIQDVGIDEVNKTINLETSGIEFRCVQANSVTFYSALDG